MRVIRVPVVDEHVEGLRCVVLTTDSEVILLSELATAILTEAGHEPAEVESLAARLVEVFGAPEGDPDGVASTRAVLAELRDRGLVELRA